MPLGRPTRKLGPVDLNKPQPGFYMTRLVRDGPFVAVVIYRPPAENPETGETTNRFGTLAATIDGEDRDVYAAWPWCAAHPISGRRYQQMLRKSKRAKMNDLGAPEANPRQRVDYNRLKPPF